MNRLNHLVIIFRYLVIQFLLLSYIFLNFFVLPPKTKKKIATKLLQVIKNEESKRLIKNGNIRHMEIRGFRACIQYSRDTTSI